LSIFGLKDRYFQSLHESLSSLPQIPIDEVVIERASKWGFLLHRKGKSVSTTDLLIAAAAYKRARILHADSDFERIASEMDSEQERIF